MLKYSLSIFKVFIFSALLLTTSESKSQQRPKEKIAVFIPIYLDEAFNGKEFKIWENKMPKVMLPGLEFYNGITLAIDSLKKDPKFGNLEIKIIDYKSDNNSLEKIIKRDSAELANTKVFLGSFNNKADIKLLADFAKQVEVPLINVNFPNNGGITNNPFYFLMNSTIGVHCKAIYNYINKKHSNDNIIFVTRNGNFEDMVSKYFQSYDSTNLLLTKNTVLTDSFYSNSLLKILDSNKNNVILCATVNEGFAIRIASVVSNAKKYSTTLIGMPTWDGIKSFEKKEYKNVDVLYTSPCNFDIPNSLINKLQSKYKSRFDASASDLVLKAYEAMMRFGKTVSMYSDNAIKLFGDNLFKVFNEVDVVPVYSKTKLDQIDYYENQKIYFIKK